MTNPARYEISTHGRTAERLIWWVLTFGNAIWGRTHHGGNGGGERKENARRNLESIIASAKEKMSTKREQSLLC